MTRAHAKAATPHEQEAEVDTPEDDDVAADERSDENAGAMEPPWVAQARDIAEQTREWVAANPFAALAAAVGAGFVIGRIFRR